MPFARLIFACLAHFALACAGETVAPPPPSPYSADIAPDLAGAPDRGRDPSVVALLHEGDPPCSAVLVAPDLALTARRCVARACDAPHEPKTLDIWSGEDLEHAASVARGHRVLLPSAACEDDLAVVILDREIPMIRTSSLRRFGPGESEHLRAVGFGDGRARLLRDHAKVASVSSRAFTIAERACIGPPGHVALDEETGEIVGVSSACGDQALYTRTDAYFRFLDHALIQSGEAARVAKAAAKDAGAPDAWTPKRLPKSEKPDRDFGDACALGVECAAGVCAADKTGRYCSRRCSAADRCPYGWRCVAVDEARKACIKTPS